MNTDCSFRIGRDHAVCQDYGVARSGEPSFVILADGCSSSPDTDVGARLLVRSAERLLPDWLGWVLPKLRGLPELGQDADAGRGDHEDLIPPGSPSPTQRRGEPSGMTLRRPSDRRARIVGDGVAGLHRRAVLAARGHAAGLGLDERCLDATLLTAAAGHGHWLAMVYGDGVLALGERGADGELRVRFHTTSFRGGYPNYPSYLVDAERRRAFEQLPDNGCVCDNGVLTREGVVRDQLQLGTFVDGCYVASGSTEVVEWIAVVTDGSSSFSATDPHDRTASRVPLPEVLRELLAFKSLSGVFVQRRVQRFLKDCEARGRQHHDDLGVGAIGAR